MNCGNSSNCVHWLYAVRTGTATSMDFSTFVIGPPLASLGYGRPLATAGGRPAGSSEPMSKTDPLIRSTRMDHDQSQEIRSEGACRCDHACAGHRGCSGGSGPTGTFGGTAV